MRRIAAWLVFLTCALVLAGCNDVQQNSARQSLETYLRGQPDDGGYDVGSTRCSASARTGFVNVVATSLFVCQAHRRNGICDRFRVVVATALPPSPRDDATPAACCRSADPGPADFGTGESWHRIATVL